MRLGRRLSAGIAHDPPAPTTPAEAPETAGAIPEITSPDQRAAEIVAAAAHRETGELTAER